MSYKFADLVDLNRFRDLFVLMNRATGLSLSLVDSAGQVLFEVGGHRFCALYHQACPECARRCAKSSAALIQQLREASLSGHVCDNSLQGYASPVVVDGEILVTVYLGQFFHEPPDQDRFREQARTLGVDEGQYLQALADVPVISRDQSQKLMAYLLQITQLMSDMGRERLGFRETAQAFQRSEERFRNLLETAPMGITVLDSAGKIVMANPCAELTLRLPRREITERSYNDPTWQITGLDGLPLPDDELPFRRVERTRQPVFGVEHMLRFPDGEQRLICVHAAPLINGADEFDGMISTVEDITESRAIARQVEQQNASLRALTDTTLDLMNQRDVQALLKSIIRRAAELVETPDAFLYLVNQAETALEMMIGIGLHEKFLGYTLAPGEGMAGKVWQSGEPLLIPNYDDWQGSTPGFRYGKPYSILGVPLPLGDHVIGVLGISLPPEQTRQIPEKIDLLTRFAHQAALALHNARLYHDLENELNERRRIEQALRWSEEKFSRAFRISPDSININRISDGLYIEVNEGFTRLTGYTAEETVGKTSRDINIWANPADRDRLVAGLRASGEVLDLEASFRVKNGEMRIGLMSARIIEVEGQACILSVTRDISERKRAEEALRRSYQLTEMRLKRLSALRTIDQAITSGKDLPDLVEEIVQAIRESLDAGGAVIRIPSLDGTRLDVAAYAGPADCGAKLKDLPVNHPVLKLPAVQRRSVYLYGPEEIEAAGLQDHFGPQHKPYAYAAAPMLAKGVVKGVIEVAYCQPADLDTEWKQFFGSLAMQTAIAIDNAELVYIKEKANFQLEQANQELRLAYDETIKGWARALELRDKETKGHSENVMELTLRLAAWLGFPSGQIEHVRRGVFLHDVGKMGIPDHILLKPGPLDEEEWKIMRQHPVYAYEMLKDIAYLKPALEVPLCHHERWDGSGYPAGLKGEAIPLVARIFAVVDVWDALLSDRPYRRAWPIEKVTAYLREQSGTLFDPHVVEEFFRMLEKEREQRSENSEQ